ncbi:MAG: hypothetical protein IPN89_17480 [Saprospiraceae bacterium]|nr:hypothetical protein [Saprospiraceae bacterium]
MQQIHKPLQSLPDGCTNTDVKTVTYTWSDDAVNPALTVPTTGLALGCNPTLPTVASVVAASSATDNCGTPTITAVAGAITGTCSKSQTLLILYRWLTNTDVKTVTYTWSDDAVNPALTVPTTGLALGCNPTLPTVASVVAASSATDNCGTPTITAVAGAITGTCSKTQTFTVTATDGCTNTDVKTVTYTWSDDAVNPALTVPTTGLALGCNPTLPTVASVVAASSATDNCGTSTITAVAGAITGTCSKSQTFTVTATDGCTNTDVKTVTYTWSDDAVNPALTVPTTGLALGCNPTLPTVASVVAASSATDNCGTPTITAVAGAITGTCSKTQTFTVTATDGCANTDVKTVTYTWSDDAVNPALTVPTTGLALGCNPTLPTVASVVAASSATDNCGTPTITAVAEPITGTCSKSQTFTLTATDACTNTDVKTVTYTLSDDAVNPTLTVPTTGLALGCNPTLPTVASVVAASSATENCGTPTITAVAGAITGTCSKSQTFTVTATDGCTNTDVKTVTYTWSDDAVNPALTVPTTGLALGCNPTLPTVASVVAASSATDNCGTPTITAVAGAITGTCSKTQTFTVTATDGCTNTDVKTVTYTWSDDAVNPALTVPTTGLALGCNPTLPTVASVVAASSATDNCGTPTITAVAGAITGTCSKTQTFTVTATDGCTNTDVKTVTYTWSDDALKRITWRRLTPTTA